MAPGRDGKWAREIIALQEDGLWGNFHTLSAPQRGASITTEQALRRLMVLGYAAEDPVIQRTLEVLRDCLKIIYEQLGKTGTAPQSAIDKECQT